MHRNLVAILLIACVAIQFPIQQVNAKGRKAPVSLAIKGGVSLGSYEAGFNWAFLKLMGEESDHVALSSITGTSAGNINAVLSVLEWCAETDEHLQPDVNNNIFWNAWIPIGFDHLFPGTSTYEKYAETFEENFSTLPPKNYHLPGNPYPAYTNSDGVFSRNAFGPIKSFIIERLAQGGFSDDRCSSIRLGLTLTSVEPAALHLKNDEREPVHTQKFVLPLVARVVNGQMRLENVRLKNEIKPTSLSEYWHVPSGGVIHLPEKDGVVNPKRLVQAMEASAAFPFFFSPVPIEHCVDLKTKESKGKKTTANGDRCPKGKVIKQSMFIDGGMLNNMPIGLAMELDNAKTPLLYIDPGRRRPYMRGEPETRTWETRGATELWWPFFLDYFNGAQESELARLIVDRPLAVNKLVQPSDRFAPVVGQYLANFAAFIDEPFRQYDYFVGVYDAIKFFSFHVKEKMKETDQASSYAGKSEDQIIDKLMDNLNVHAKERNGRGSEASFVVGEIACRESIPDWRIQSKNKKGAFLCIDIAEEAPPWAIKNKQAGTHMAFSLDNGSLVAN